MSRTTTNEPVIRLACRIAASAARNRGQTVADAVWASSRTLESRWETVRRQQSRVAQAIDRGWFLAARRVLSDGPFDRDAVLPAWDHYCRVVDDFLPHSTPSLTISELHVELQDVAEEFEEVGWDRRGLWATTEPIVLEGIYLGRFQIKLRLDRIGSPNADDDFDVLALDPNPAGGDSEVTHPQVSGGRLCQGEVTGPIRLALEQGRLVDFFQLVHAVLRTYNPDSPFVRLDAWDGVCCGDCGTSVSSGDTSYWQGCDNDFCDECSSYCQDCNEIRCVACLVECRSCGESHCGSCLSACEGCGSKGFCGSCLAACRQCEREGFCDSCLVACAQCERKEFCVDCLEHDRCASCRGVQAEEDDHAKDNDGENERDATEAAANPVVEVPTGRVVTADPGVHADRLAQAPVPVSCG